MNATRKTVKALVESEVGAKVAWVRRVAKKKFRRMTVSTWAARTTDGREWWVIPYSEASVYPAEAWMDQDRLLNSYLDLVFCLSDAEIAERYGELPSVGTYPVEPQCRCSKVAEDTQ